MADFSSDINEAKNRVLQMQQRAKNYVSNSANQNAKDIDNQIENNNPESGDNSFLPFNLKNLLSLEDNSNALILVLILILSNEKADNMLILALLYILF